jgi:hypothetical protein
VKRTVAFIWVVLAPFSLINAGIIQVGSFSGQFSEGFETQAVWGFLSEIVVFDGRGIVRNLASGSDLNITMGWGSSDTGDRVTPHSGSRFMGSTYGAIEWIFGTPAVSFGGYFTTLSLGANLEGAVVTFFDAEDKQIGQMDVTAPFNNQWTWNGWASDIPIKRAQITGFGSPDWANIGGFVMHDGMEYTPIPEPITLLLLGFGVLAVVRKRRFR